MIGPAIQHTLVVSNVAAAFPFTIHELTSTNEYIATAMISYALAYTLEHTISKVVSRGRFKTHPRFYPVILASQAAILVFLEYDLVRSSKYGTAYLEAYPTAKVVAAFVDAKSDAGTIDQTRIIKAPLDYGEDSINPNAYVRVASLAIKEWGIRIPLSQKTKGLYYLPGSASKFSSYYRTLGQTSISDKDCYLGVRRGVKGEGIASITRTLITSRDALGRPAGIQTPYKQVGNYLYHIEARSNVSSCLGRARASGFADSLVWATVNITPL